MILRYGTPSLVMLGGVPGAGKSTFLDRFDLGFDVEVVRADDCRGRVQVLRGLPFHAYDEDSIPEARRDFFRALDYAVMYNKNIIAEASYLTPHSRNEIIRYADSVGYLPHLLLITAPLGAVRDAQKNRLRSVPDDVLVRHWENYERLADELEDSQLDIGLATATMLDRSEAECISSIDFNKYTP